MSMYPHPNPASPRSNPAMFYPFPAVNIGDLIVTSSYLNSPYDLLSSSRTETPTVLQRPRMRDPFVSPPYWYSDDKVIAVQPAQVDIKNEVRLLRNAIERSGQLSRGQIAAILGVSRRSLSAWVSGETTPSEQNLGGLRTLGELAQELVRQQTLPLGAILRDPDSADAVVEAVQDVDLPRAIRAALRTDSDKVSLALDLTHAEGEVRYTDPETGGQKGQKPAELGALPPEALLHLAEVAGYGTRKYDRYNYLKGYKWSLSFDAMERHLLQFWGGEYDDAESGLPHLAHAAWHCLTLIAFYERAIGTDDRWQK